jgi:hypothetical protein
MEQEEQREKKGECASIVDSDGQERGILAV